MDDVDLLSSNIQKIVKLPNDVKQQIQSLKNKLRAVIEEVSQRIENRKYESSEKAIEEMGVNYSQLNKVKQLVNADKKVHMSCQALRITVETFTNFNKTIIKRLEEAEHTNNPHTERNLILGNAILVHELTDFVIEYLESYKIYGMEDIVKLQQDMIKTIDNLRAEQASLKERTKANNIEEQVRKQVLSNIESREKSLDLIAHEWELYMKAITNLQNDIAPITSKLPTLKLIRDNATSQINIIGAIAVMQVVKSNLRAVEATVTNLENIELTSISPDRVRRLLGIDV